jgi:predicted Zn-dependent protease
MMAPVAIRVTVALVAVLAIAFLAVGLRNTWLEQRGLELGQSTAATHDPEIARQAEHDLRAAETLNPDQTPTLYRGGLAFRLRRPQEAVDLLRRVARQEDENLDAWGLLAQAALAAGDRGLARQAAARARELSAGGG